MLRIFGLGTAKALAGAQTEGVVTQVKTCWWLKVNTKPVRHGTFDCAKFPHVIYFTYTVIGQAYRGKRYVHWNKRCPQQGEKLTVCYERENPAKYAVVV